MSSRRPRARLSALALGLSAPLALLSPPASAEESPGETPAAPVARAVTADGRPARIADVLEHCGAKRTACSFAIDPKSNREYATAVKSLGNAVVNCTQSDMGVDRTVTLRTSSTDNIGGEISGRITAEGTVSASGEVTTNLANDITSENKTPNLKDGPTSTNGTKTSVSGGAKVAGSLSAKLAFEAAFKATYSKSWTIDNTESTVYKTVVKPYDMLVFGASASMRRVVGNLVTGEGSKILNVSVDSPSMVNSSTFVAQTYAVPDNLCGRKRPVGDTIPDGDNTSPPPGLVRSVREVPAARAVPPGADPKGEVVLPSHGS
ncbi:hypothetical protein AQF52_5853 [Streptomyces venezuelae]|uniref:hypothetical protein n=1 Tax=Streptomyces gardneri TaxID=66892 RepID=UPI0006BCC14B|nr:hypothetical protein [Streptomyces gardneri]ALO11446.1 hypothetical protein AQF52_5853 [Streptomyces venezuelae]QPK48355.1 hypothetical protein H4W23_29415 [Streptomyces gardneri]WRK39821.1 hypothetical protein U0M97_29555 [Streptomyces venezuelae]CUM38020.1 hypothetical protein BN2537_5005 [Streptomyces venezuelae]